MQSRQVSPITVAQIPRWRITRLLEMIERDYSAGEVAAELTSWLASGKDRVPQAFNLQAAAARAAHAINADGESLVRFLPTDLDGRLTTRCRDVLETAVFAALAPHLDQMVPEMEALRTHQCSFGFSESPLKPTFEAI